MTDRTSLPTPAFATGTVDGLCTARRRYLHERAAGALLSVYGKLPGTEAARVAAHYEQAGYSVSAAACYLVRGAARGNRVCQRSSAGIVSPRYFGRSPPQACLQTEKACLPGCRRAWSSVMWQGWREKATSNPVP